MVIKITLELGESAPSNIKVLQKYTSFGKETPD